MLVRRLSREELSPLVDIFSALASTDVPSAPPFRPDWLEVEPEGEHHAGQAASEQTWIVTAGRGSLELTRGDSSEAEELAIETGDVLSLPAHPESTIRARGEQALAILCIRKELVPEPSRTHPRPARAVLFGSPPTPNGDAHLGHLAGPYLGADVLTRYLRLRGVDARFSTWTDDYQNYVRVKADKLGEEPAATARRYGDEILASFAAVGIDLTHYMRPPESGAHGRMVSEFFEALHARGKLIERVVPTLYTEHEGRFLTEGEVAGSCANCGSGAGVGTCEDCGFPNDGLDLVEPRRFDPLVGDTGEIPTVRPLRRLLFPLSEHRETLRRFLDEATLSPRLRVLSEALLAQGLPDVPVSQPSTWGIPVPVAGFEGQTLVSWLEMCPTYLSTAWETAESCRWDLPEASLLRWEDTEIVQFFGADNGFYHALLYPALYAAYDAEGRPPSVLVMNEFYRLDGTKFSTSRNHAMWIHDLAHLPSDAIRFHLCRTRPETSQTSFSREALEESAERELQAGWQGWLVDLAARLAKACGGRAPEPKTWTAGHRRFHRQLIHLGHETAAAYEPDGFSPRRAVRQLMELVVTAREFGESQDAWSCVPGREDARDTALALELAAARALALRAWPILPRFSERLWRDLGGESLQSTGWEENPGWVAADTEVRLAPDYFSHSGGGLSAESTAVLQLRVS